MYLDEAIYNIVVNEAKEIKSFVGRKLKCMEDNANSTLAIKGEVVEVVHQDGDVLTISKPMNGFDGMKIHTSMIGKEFKLLKKDTIVEAIVDKFKDRSDVGIKKYNTTLDREDLTTEQWIDHAIEEAMDMILYLERLKRDITNIKKAVRDGK
ncbi:ABC-type histidine transport system, ATPase component [Flavobacterium phage vB_FspP_elemoE_6-9C]|uniref:ABC-type histidine transport system, ATPase component n=1 Tax=Flavobacterium phage vB_FspP_elemoE_6-9C TaxID=2743829 RepID=A0A7D7J4R2_9CAUD|nr:ABC-type histidine transport system, ATPase component [Flavobacterium phage vB_FspP_elemoE_6-9C]QMP85271.1 ABC-type histidine transport system, ATPase component [Flavobacterium phage vB_FspP_elemoE_6-9C]